MAIELNKVTWYSKLTAVLFFLIVLPLWMFFLGTYYQKTKSQLNTVSEVSRGVEENNLESAIQYEMIDYGGYSFPVITQYSDKSILEKVNAELGEIRKEFSCMTGWTDGDLRSQIKERSPYIDRQYSDAELNAMTTEDLLNALGYYYKVDANVTFSEHDIFSIDIDNAYNCGGAYPSAGNVSVTFDMQTGKRVEIKDLFLHFTSQKKEIGTMILSQSIKSGTNYDTSAECRDVRERGMDNLEFFSYYISAEGVIVIPSLPHAVQVCTAEFVVPISQVARFADPNGIIARLRR